MRSFPYNISWILVRLRWKIPILLDHLTWNDPFQLLFTLKKLENRVYFATWCKITAWTILPLANMDECCHAFSAGKQVGNGFLSVLVNCRFSLTLNPNPFGICVSFVHLILPHETKYALGYQTWNLEIES